MKMILIVITKLSVVKFLIHVDIRLCAIDKIEQYKVGDIDDDKQFEDGVALLQYRCFFLFETEEWLNYFHLYYISLEYLKNSKTDNSKDYS